MSHPVKLIVSDDLQRSRATVFFRLLLAIPHLLWMILWGIAAYVVAIPNWFATLARGTAWPWAHRFTANWLRYVVQVNAYVYLLANPYPRFDGASTYPVDVEIAPAAPQNHWKVLFRLPLALPALLLSYALWGGSFDGGGSFGGGGGGLYVQAGGVALAVVVLGWFAALAVARMPRGLRDTGAYGLAYVAQLYAYLLLLTDRYPNSDPLAALPDVPTREHPISLAVEDDRRRSRATTFFRLLLAIPHFVWLLLWGIGAFFATIANWFAVLFTGRSPEGLHDFLSSYLRYATHVSAYLYLAADPYPGFDGDEEGYPIELSVAERARQNRWTVAFRLVLAVPAFVISSAYGTLALAAAFLGWFTSLARAEMPLGLRNAIVLWARYNAQTYGYLMLLTDVYPYSGPVAATAPAPAEEPQQFLPPLPPSAPTEWPATGLPPTG